MGAGDSGMRQTQAFPRVVPSHRLMGRQEKNAGSPEEDFLEAGTRRQVLGATLVKEGEGTWQAFQQLCQTKGEWALSYGSRELLRSVHEHLPT